MAAERALTIATTIQATIQQARANPIPEPRKASAAPVSANGSANTECSNRIMSRLCRRRVKNIFYLIVRFTALGFDCSKAARRPTLQF